MVGALDQAFWSKTQYRKVVREQIFLSFETLVATEFLFQMSYRSLLELRYQFNASRPKVVIEIQVFADYKFWSVSGALYHMFFPAFGE